ncbi:hypothetical protein BGW37DRAFT_478148 [Umbelopsis sp. PMI_123]|nr:hypothetical protein BGW37DRAFT_478148 [Umbelopsis sp. PMI_123]
MSTKTLEARLEDHGYIHHCKLVRILPASSNRLSTSEYSDPIKALLDKIERPLAQHIDVLLSEAGRSRNEEEQEFYQQFINVIGSTTLTAGMSSSRTNKYVIEPRLQREYVANDERRSYVIRELIETEENYVKNMNVLSDVFARPLRVYAKDKRNFVLGLYECNSMFMNIEMLVEANQMFLDNLYRWRQPGSNLLFGDICATHMFRCECYSKFLSGVEDAQIINLREQKVNPAYRAFLDRAKDHPDAKRQTLHDLLVQPGQRIGRYTMMLKDLLKYTSNDHPDYPGLSAALKRAEEIATMADDTNTRLAKTFFNMHKSIENCPAPLINQNRRLIRHIDATELDIVSRKPLRPVTIFLFTDKVMIVRRPAYNVNGFELCGLVNSPEVVMRTRSSSTSGLESFLPKRNDKSKRSSTQEKRLKFKGWVSLDDVELLDGSGDFLPTFMLQTNATSMSAAAKQPASPTVAANMALENYFIEQPLRLFSTSPPQEEVPHTRSQISAHTQKKEEFCKQFHKSKAILNQNDSTLVTYYRMWKEFNLYSNFYDIDRYPAEGNKNNAAVLYVDDPNFDIQQCLSRMKDLPPVIGIVQVVPDEGFRFSVRSRVALEVARERNIGLKGRDPNATGDNSDFQSIFWSNIIAYGWAATQQCLMGLQKTLHSKLQRQDSRPRKAKSITTLSKIFNPTVHTGINPQYVAYLNAQSMARTRPISTSGPIPHHSELEVSRSISTSSTVRSNNSVSSRGSYESSTGSEVSDEFVQSDSAASPASNRLLSMFKRTDELPKEEMLFRVVTPSSSPVSQRTISPLGEISALEAHIAQLRISINRDTETKRQYETQLDEIQSVAGNIDSTIRSISRNSMLSSSTWSSAHTGFSTLASTSSISTVDEEMLRKFDNDEQYAMGSNEVAVAMERLREEFEDRWTALAKNCELLGAEVDGLALQLKEKEKQLAELRADYQDSTDENKILYDTFNDELEQILSDSHSEDGLTSRPSHPSPEIQIKRKLKNVLLDRNSWRKRARYSTNLSHL